MSVLKIKDGDLANWYLGGFGNGTSPLPFYSIPAAFYTEVIKGNVAGHTVIHKFGRNEAVTTAFEPITSLGVYRMPQVSAATTLRVKAGGSANDTAAGTGARQVTLVGLDETGASATETLATAGASASSATTTTFLRLTSAYVSVSGTYSTTSGSHAATITIENGSGGTDWASIELNEFAVSQARVGVYSVPLGKTAYVFNPKISSGGSSVNIIFFERKNLLETAAPYTPMQVLYQADSLGGNIEWLSQAPLGPFPALTDFGVMAKSSSSSNVDVEFDILLVDD